MVVGKEEVIVLEGQQGIPVIHELCETTDTALGRRVRELLAKAGLPFVKTEAQATRTPEMIALEVMLTSNAMWFCPKCKQGDGIDIPADSDHQAALKKAYEQHERISPDCEAAKVKIYHVIDGRMTELQDLSLIASAKRAQ